jgi:hypothetical protein
MRGDPRGIRLVVKGVLRSIVTASFTVKEDRYARH